MNLLIVKGENGEVQVFKNLKGFKEVLFSVVVFCKNGIFVGDKVCELKDCDLDNVFFFFKWKMGIDSSYWVEQIMEIVLLVQFFVFVFNELKIFFWGDDFKFIVIMILVLFDIIQLNVIKEVGKIVGFEEIVLLQEFIVVCFVVFNQQEICSYGKWLVYDLGGGIFDVVIVEILEENFKVIDYVGNNFFGGFDFDIFIVWEVIVL